LDGGAKPSSCLVAAVVTVALAILPSPGQPWLPSCKRRPHGRGLGVWRWAALWPWRSRLSERLPYRSSVPCPRRFRFATACRVDWTVSGRIDRTCGVRKAVRSWRPSWTPDTTAQTSDGDQACGRCGIEHGRRWSRRAVPMLAHCRPVRSGPGRAGRVVGRGRLAEAWSDAGRWRCPLLGRRCPDRVQTQWLGGHLELGMSGRPDGPEVRRVRRPGQQLPGVRRG
jgi:hypothetical protein